MPIRKWNPSMNDATSLAAFRWLANTLENEAMALYVTHPDKFAEIEDVLRRALHGLHGLKTTHYVAMEENGCPDGWVLCDGVCQPSCDTISEESNVASFKNK